MDRSVSTKRQIATAKSSTMLFVAFLMWLATAGATEDDRRPCNPPNSNTSDFRQHCRRCNVGQGITMFCMQVRNVSTPNSWCYKDTVCSECTPGTYQDKNNHSESCIVCQTCDREKGLSVVRECSKTANTVCGCEAGSYFDKNLDRCTRCSSCSPGAQPQNCGGESDTKCVPCADGTFSDGFNLCKTCKKCAADQRVEVNCSAFSDTVCVRLQFFSTSYNLNISESDATRGSLMIYLSCGLMGLVVVAVVTYAMWKHCNRSIEKKRTTAAYSQNSNSPQLYLYMTVDRSHDDQNSNVNVNANARHFKAAQTQTQTQTQMQMQMQTNKDKVPSSSAIVIEPVASSYSTYTANGLLESRQQMPVPQSAINNIKPARSGTT